MRKAIWITVGTFAAFIGSLYIYIWYEPREIVEIAGVAAGEAGALLILAIGLGIQLIPAMIACNKGRTKWLYLPALLIGMLPEKLAIAAWFFMLAWAIFGVKEETELIEIGPGVWTDGKMDL